jgi:hypothetical protein
VGLGKDWDREYLLVFKKFFKIQCPDGPCSPDDGMLWNLEVAGYEGLGAL